MKIGFGIAAGLFRGSRQERITKVFALGTWFALVAYVSATLLDFVDRITPTDLSGSALPAVIGAVAAVILIACKGL